MGCLAIATSAPENALDPANVDPPAAPFVFKDEQRLLVAVIGFTHGGAPLGKVYYGTIMHPDRPRAQEDTGMRSGVRPPPHKE